MKLTLMELAQAIADKKKFWFVDLGEYSEIEPEKALIYWIDFPYQVRIQTEPKEFWCLENSPDRYESLDGALTARPLYVVKDAPIYYCVEVLEK